MSSTHQTDILDAQLPPLESYVVRIYRRDPHLPSRITGTVERVADGSEQRFKGSRQLQAILTQRSPANASIASLSQS